MFHSYGVARARIVNDEDGEWSKSRARRYFQPAKQWCENIEAASGV
jgi:hypothetical protein